MPAATAAVSVAVVDTSAIAAIVFAEPAAEGIVERLGTSRLIAPSLLPYEIVSVAAGKVRRGEVSSEAAGLAVQTFTRVSIELHEPDLLEVLRLTGLTRLTAYDAAYLWLARSLSAELVTLDEKLLKAWSRLPA